MIEQFPADSEKIPGETPASFARAPVIRSGSMKFMGF
jgi:hypothetical protein